MDANETSTTPLRWPPPGLERLQGDLWRVAVRGALAGAVMVLPLLFVVARSQDFVSMGPFADAWWVTLVLAAVGLAFAMDALATSGRVLRRAADALGRGYDVTTVLRVLADVRKDMGFLLQGVRHFSVMESDEREGVAHLRVLAVSCHAAAGVWLTGILGVALPAAAQGWLSHTGLWVLTLAPAMVLYVLGGVSGALEDGRVRRARRAWHSKPWAQDLDAREIEAWRVQMSLQQGRSGPVPASRAGTGFRRAAFLITGVAVLVAVPVLTLIPTSAIGPLLAMVAMPRLSQLQERAARVEAYRGLRVEPDAAITPLEAGQLLQDLLYVGSSSPPTVGEMPPVTRYDAPWLPDLADANPVGEEPHRWAEEIFARVVDDPDAAMLAFLDGIAAHPAQESFARLARAAEMDAAGARWTEEIPEGRTMASLPIPRFGGIREAANARLAAAAADLARGRTEEAERKIREVVSVGFLLGDQGPTLIENLIGHVVAGNGGRAMQRFYEATGRQQDAQRMEALVTATTRATGRVYSPVPEGTQAYVRSLPAMVSDTTAVRGVRWEYFTLTATLAPCLNLHQMVFGAGEEYEAFISEARASLVRWPSEEKLFELARVGYWGAPTGGKERWFGRFLGVAMRPGPGTCNNVVRQFDKLRQVM